MTALPAPLPQPVTRRVLLITHDPRLASRGGRTLREWFGWNDPEEMAREYIADVRLCSHGYADFQVAESIRVSAFPVKGDGFAYDERSYLRARQSGSYHRPDTVDYTRLINEFGILERIESGATDEVWLFAFPFAGYYESIMGGPEAFWCNGPPLLGTAHCSRRFVIMGFNFERGVGEMLEDLGHRAEAILQRVFQHAREDDNLFERFMRHDKTNPGAAECGSIHFAPNSARDYDWGNARFVPSRCDNWLRFPHLDGAARRVNCSEWGNGDMRAHHRWWLQHLPHFGGASGGVSCNWWEYVIDPDHVR